MSSINDDYILVEESRNLDEDIDEKDLAPEESEDASKRVLNQQGIFVLTKEGGPETLKTPKEFSRELLQEGGIEIIESGEGEEGGKFYP